MSILSGYIKHNYTKFLQEFTYKTELQAAFS